VTSGSPGAVAVLGLLSFVTAVAACAPHPIEPAVSAVPLSEGGSSLFDDPAAARGWYLRARVAEARGDWAEADRAYGWMARRGRGFVGTWREMGDYQLRMGQARQAVASYFRALDLDPDHGPTHAGLARAWLELGQLDEVEVHLDAAAAAGEDVVEWRARLAWRRGDVEGAVRILHSALPPERALQQLARAELARQLGDQSLVERLVQPLLTHPTLAAQAQALREEP